MCVFVCMLNYVLTFQTFEDIGVKWNGGLCVAEWLEDGTVK